MRFIKIFGKIVLGRDKFIRMKRYIFLFCQFFKIALFVIGGGLAMLPVIEQVFVKNGQLLTEDEFVEMVAMTQTVPGLIAINSSIFVGYKVAGLVGVLFSVLGVLLPSLIIISLIAMLFPLLNIENRVVLEGFDCIRASVAGIFVVMFVRMFKKVVKNVYILLIVTFLSAMFFIPLQAGFVILLALVLGCVYSYLEVKLGIEQKRGEQ